MYNQAQPDVPNTNNNDQSFVRQVGRITGRIVATLGAAVTMRVVGREMSQMNQQNNNAAQQQNTLLQEIQQEIPVAAATLVAWNTRIGAETGANVSEFLVNNIREMSARYIIAPVQNPRAYMPSFSDHLNNSFMAHVSNTVVQGAQNLGASAFGNDQNNTFRGPRG